MFTESPTECLTEPPILENGAIISPNTMMSPYPVDTEFQYQCSPGFTFVGNSLLSRPISSCQSDETFSFIDGTCNRKYYCFKFFQI